MLAGVCGCSDNKYNVDDSITSMLSGEYAKDGIWRLSVTVNGEPVNNYGHVRLDSKTLETANFIFVNVIPEEPHKEFKNIPLNVGENGFSFTINYDNSGKNITISGIVALGEMSVTITM